MKNGFVPRIRDELSPTLKALQIAQCPFRNLPEKRASRWGESLTAEKMDQCRWVNPKLVCQIAFVEIHSQTLQTRFQASSNFSPISLIEKQSLNSIWADGGPWAPNPNGPSVQRN